MIATVDAPDLRQAYLQALIDRARDLRQPVEQATLDRIERLLGLTPSDDLQPVQPADVSFAGAAASAPTSASGPEHTSPPGPEASGTASTPQVSAALGADETAAAPAGDASRPEPTPDAGNLPTQISEAGAAVHSPAAPASTGDRPAPLLEADATWSLEECLAIVRDAGGGRTVSTREIFHELRKRHPRASCFPSNIKDRFLKKRRLADLVKVDDAGNEWRWAVPAQPTPPPAVLEAAAPAPEEHHVTIPGPDVMSIATRLYDSWHIEKFGQPIAAFAAWVAKVGVFPAPTYADWHAAHRGEAYEAAFGVHGRELAGERVA